MKILLSLLISSQLFAATIKSGNSTDEMTVDPTSKAAHVTIYDLSGNPVGQSGGSLNVNVSSITGTVGVTQVTSPWVVSGSLGRTWNLLNTTDSVNVGNFPSTFAVTQSTSPWVISGTVTSNIGTTGGLALDSSLATINTTLGTPAQNNLTAAAPNSVRLSDGSAFYNGFKSGDSIGNTAFIANAGTNLNTSALNLESTQSAFKSANHSDLLAINTTLGSPFQAGGSIGNTTFASTQSGAWTTGRTWTLSSGTDSISAAISNFPATQAVTQSTSPWVVSGTVTANQGGTWTVQPGNTANTTAWKVDGSAVTQPVSGTVTANAGTGTFQTNVSQINGVTPLMGNGVTGTGSQRVTIASDNTAFTVNAAQSGTWNINNVSGTVSLPTGAATSANQTNGNEKTQIVDGSNATVGPVTTLSAVNYLPVVQASSGATGSAVPVRTQQIGGSDGTNLRTLVTDSTGLLKVISSPVDSIKATYRASITGLVLANTPTDFLSLTGSGTKTIKVSNIHLSCTQTAGTYPDIVLLKRSTANSGGTSTSPTIVPLDSNNAAATATLKAYTVNPTLGTLVGNLMSEKIQVNSPTIQVGGGNNPTGTNQRGQLWEFGRLGQSITLRGTSEVLSLNGNSVTITGNSCDSWWEWTEE